jgi:glutathionyl-hydroquinone reductase
MYAKAQIKLNFGHHAPGELEELHHLGQIAPGHHHVAGNKVTEKDLRLWPRRCKKVEEFREGLAQ